MEKCRKGFLARSKAGHDAGKVYIIVETTSEYAFLSDGKLREMANPKKKKWKHLQMINIEHSIEEMDDAQIRKILKEYNREEI